MREQLEDLKAAGDCCFFAGSYTYTQLTNLLVSIVPRCQHCSTATLLICVEPHCGELFCERCESELHYCHRINELQMALVDHPKLFEVGSDNYSQSQSLYLIVAYMRLAFQRYEQQTIEAGRPDEPRQHTRRRQELTHYQNLLQQSMAIDQLVATVKDALDNRKHWPLDTEEMIWQAYRYQLAEELSRTSFAEIRGFGALIPQIDAEVWQEAMQTIANYERARTLQPQCLMQFISHTALRTYMERTWVNLILPVGRHTSVSAPSNIIAKGQPSRLKLARYQSGYPIPQSVQELFIEQNVFVPRNEQLNTQFICLPPNLQALHITSNIGLVLDLPRSLKKLRIEFWPSDFFNINGEDVREQIMTAVCQLPQLKELRIVLMLTTHHVRMLLQLAKRNEFRALTYKYRDTIVLRNHYIKYRRSLMQAMLIQRSRLQFSFFREFVLDYAETDQPPTAHSRPSRAFNNRRSVPSYRARTFYVHDPYDDWYY